MALTSHVAISCWYLLQWGVEPHGSLLPLHLSLTALVVCRFYSNNHSGCVFRTARHTLSRGQHLTALHHPSTLTLYFIPLFMMLPNPSGGDCVLVLLFKSTLWPAINSWINYFPVQSSLTKVETRTDPLAWTESFRKHNRSFCKIIVLTLGCKTITPAQVLDQMYSTKHAFPPTKQHSVKAERCWLLP